MEHRIQVNSDVSEALIEKACLDRHLEITMKTCLKSLPPNVHWHFKRNKEKGVLEITLLFASKEIVLSCKANRESPWVLTVARELLQEFSE